MVKRSKLIYVIGSVIIGVIALLVVLFALIAGGVINATQTKIVFSSATAEFVYDGKVHKKTDWELVDGTLRKGHKAVVTVSGSQEEAGKSENRISAVITDENGADVTNYYEIEYQAGTLSVSARPVTISSGDKSKVYDGTPLTYGAEDDAECEIADGELVKGHTLQAVYTASVTEAGRILNTFTPHVYDEKGREKTSNYSIACDNGVLEVTKRKINFLSGSDEKEFDGIPLTNSSYKFPENALLEGHTETVTMSGSQLYAGHSDNTFTVTIADADGKEVTANYEVISEYGTLTVTRRGIEITTDGATKEYDGTPLTADGYEMTSGTLVEGHTIELELNGSRTEAGTGYNTFTYKIYDEDGNEVTGTYNVTAFAGALFVTQKPIFVETNNATKIYDGLELTDSYYSISGLLEGHSAEVTVSGAQTNAGSSKNDCNVDSITDEDGNDVMRNYLINKLIGTLIVKPRKITVETLPYYWVYDGTEHSYPESETAYRITSNDPGTGLAENHELSLSTPAAITEVGTCENCIADLIISYEGEDVTENYEVEECLGKLYVTHRPITVRTGSDEKEYDGTPLTCIEYWVSSSYKTVEGHTVSAAVTGSQTEPGESKNTISVIEIKDESGKDVSYNYEVTRDPGVLRVFAAAAPEKEKNDLADGSEIKGGNENDKLAVTVLSERDGKIYLRYSSYGDYTGRGWTSAKSFERIFNGGYSANYLASIALNNAGYSSYKVTIDVYGNNYLLPYYTDTDKCLYDIQSSDVVYSGDTENSYICYYYQYDFVKNGAIPSSKLTLDKYSDFEKAYREYVYGTYMNVDAATAAYLQSIIDEQGFVRNDPDLIKKVASYIQGAANYNLQYNKALDNESNIVIKFLQEYKEGICQHYASAATLLFRQLGLPARYVIGYTGTTKAGEEVQLTGKDAHAWVEVYIDGMGWVYVEVTGGQNGAGDTNETTGKGLEIKPVNEYYKFDDKSLTYFHSGELQGLADFLAKNKGYSYQAIVLGQRSSPGKTECTIDYFRMFDADGNDVTDSFIKRNKVTFGTGILQVYLAELTVRTGAASKIYDGTPLTCPDEVKIIGNLLFGHEIQSVMLTGIQLNAGVTNNTCEIKIIDKDGIDVTDVYKINNEYGKLIVEGRKITVTAESSSAPVNDKDRIPLKNDGYAIEGDGIADGQEIEVKIYGSQSAIGKSENKIVSVKIVDKDGNDVTANYLITTVNGWLTVTPPENKA